MVLEAEAMLAIAKALEPFTKERACAVMAGACIEFQEYVMAMRFLEGAITISESRNCSGDMD